nr:RNA-directed DNA polymerase [Tanacetum cinerariifolium]
MSSRRPSVNRSSTQTTELPTQEDHICGYRAMARARYQVARETRKVFGRNNYNLTPESIVDPERQLELSREKRANLVPAKVLYSNNRNNVVDHLTTTGITAIPGERRSVKELEGMSWNLKHYEQTSLAIKKQVSKLEWENLFAAKRGKNHTILHISKEEDTDDDNLPHLKFQKFKQVAAQIISNHEEQAFPSTLEVESTRSYQPSYDSIMKPSVYPPAQQNPQPFYRPDYQFGYPQGKGKTFNRGYDPGLWSEVISRWESITINRLNNQTWSDNTTNLAFVENLLGENEPQNITSQVRQLILLEDLYRGSTDEQDMAYKDSGRITCEETKNLWSFLEDFRQLTIKSGSVYFPSTTGKLFAKLISYLSKKIEESFKAKYPGLNSGVLPVIKFTHNFVLEMCEDAALAKELRDLSLCYVIPIPERIFAKDCRSKQGNIARSTIYQELDLDDKWDIVSADFDDSTVYSISEREGNTHQSISVMVQDTLVEEAVFMTIKESDESDSEQEEEDDQFSHRAFMFHPGPPTKIAEMVQSVGSWKPNKELPTQSKECEHNWKENTVTNYTICYYCGILTTYMPRLNCPKCQLTSCALCAKKYLGKTVNVKGKQPQKPKEENDFSSNEAEQEQKDEEIRELKSQLQNEKEKHMQEHEEFPLLRNSQTARPCIETEVQYSRNAAASPKVKKITNQLYNIKVEFEIPSCPMFGTTAIIDTRASTCCINKKVIPEDALEPLTQTVFFNGLNSRQQATHRIKQRSFLIEGNKFKIPLKHAFDMRDSNGIEMLIEANFLRSMNGGIRIEGDEITIYKKWRKPYSPLCLSKEYEDHLRRSHEDFQPLSRIFTKAIFTHEEPGALYRHYQLKANQTPIRMNKSNAWGTVAQDIEVLTAKEAVKAMRSLQAIIQCKAQICFGKSTKDNHWSDQREDIRVQNKEARRIIIELEALAQRLGHNNI